MGQIIEADEQSFDAVVNGITGPVVVSFGAPWCGPCLTLAPVLAQLAEKPPGFTVVNINADQSPALAGRFGVRSIPALYAVREGRMSTPFAGPHTAEAIGAWHAAAAADRAIPTEAAPRAVAEADPVRDDKPVSLRKPYLLWSAVQAGAGYLLLTAAATPLMTGIAGVMLGYTALRVSHNLLTTPAGRKRRLEGLLDRLGAHPQRRWMLAPRYMMDTARVLGNGAVFCGGIALMGAAFSAGGVGAALGFFLLSVLMTGKGSIGMLMGLSSAVTTAALPHAAAIRAQRKALPRRGDDVTNVITVPLPGFALPLAPRLSSAVNAFVKAAEPVAAMTALPAIATRAREWVLRP